MRYSTNYVIIFFLFLTNIVYGQSGYEVDKDYRIAKYEKSIIEFLINKQQFDVNKVQFRTKDYQGKIYIRKCLEIYRDSSKNILLVQFGSLADHARIYWGILDSTRKFLFYKMDDLEFKKLTKQIDDKTIAVIATYIKQSPP